MNWTELLKGEMESAYGASEKLLTKVTDPMLGWKPSTGSNWMTTGQLLMHLSSACGATCKGFVTGDWGMPHDASQEQRCLPAEKNGHSKKRHRDAGIVEGGQKKRLSRRWQNAARPIWRIRPHLPPGIRLRWF